MINYNPGEKRVALVIGNAAYQHANTLRNPANDARAIGNALSRLGFSGAEPRFNLDYNDLRRALQDFSTHADGADMAVIYFSGYGIAVDGRNYLIPVDAKLEHSRDVDFETTSLDQVLFAVGGAHQLGLIILDACRNNPFQTPMRHSGEMPSIDQQPRYGRTRSIGQGLHSIEPSRNVLVACAAKHGTFALDGKGDHSPFVEALIDHIEKPGIEIRLLFGQVRDDVLERTRNQQEPYLYSALGGQMISLKLRDEPTLPQQQELGLQFAPRDDGKIDLKRSGIAPPDDLAEIAAMRGAIIEAVDDLVVTLDGSNAYGSICSVATRYKSVINADELSVDLLYAYGIRLENARTRLGREIQSGDYPDLAVAAGEALDSILALHGPTVYSTARGRELVEKARAFKEGGIAVEAYKLVAEQVATAIHKADDAATENAREVISEVTAEIGDGPHPERSTQIGRTALSNFINAAANGLHKACQPDVVERAVEDGTKNGFKKLATAAVVGVPTVTATVFYAAAPALWTFFIANAPLLQQLSIVAGSELSWLPSFLNWLETKRAKLKL